MGVEPGIPGAVPAARPLEVPDPLSEDVRATVQRLVERRLTVACAESLTGGLLTSTMVEVPGASRAVLLGVVAYDTAMKSRILGVSSALIDRVGTVAVEVAEGMAEGVRALAGADLGVATTGVAGPGPHEGHPAGTVALCVSHRGRLSSGMFHFMGDRAEVRRRSVEEALRMLAKSLEDHGEQN